MLALIMHVLVMFALIIVWFDAFKIVCIALKKIIYKDTLHYYGGKNVKRFGGVIESFIILMHALKPLHC